MRRRRPRLFLKGRNSCSRRQLLRVFALIFAPLAAGTARPAFAACVEFTTPPAISLTAGGAQSVFLADVDGDGNLDALSASSADSKIAWYVNQSGDGSLWSLHTISTASYGERAVVAADIDGDGDLDALAAGGNPKLVAWHENLAPGDGSSWTRHVISTNADLALDVVAADLDGDGDLDAITASRFDNKIAWYENLAPGNGSSWTSHDIATDTLFATSASAADVDGDGDLDILYTAYTSDVLGWFENNNASGNASTWVQHSIFTADQGPYFVVPADVDGDGDLDAVAAFAAAGKFAWFENLTPGNGSSWTIHTVTTNASSPLRVSVADVDGDGDPDVLAPSFGADKIAWLENDGSGGGWTEHTLSTTSAGANWVVAGDLDGDGDLDLASASQNDSTIAWYRNGRLHDAALFAAPAPSWYATQSVLHVASGDLDGDGEIDLVSSSPNGGGVVWLANGGTGTSWTVGTVDSASGATTFAVADLDGDGDADIAAASYSGAPIVWCANDGAGSGWTAHTVSNSVFGTSLAAADLDGDGDLDLVAAEYQARVAWYENDGDGGGWNARTVAIDNAPWWVEVADLDRDGDLDVAWADNPGKSVVWATNDGSPLDGGWSSHVAADWSILATTNDRPTAVESADVDGDGDLDLFVTRNAGSYVSHVAWLENDGSPATGAWAVHSISSAPISSWSVESADVDGDGDADAISTGSDNNKVLWHENLGQGGAWTDHLVATANGAYAAIAADLDGDGDLDVASVAFSDYAVFWSKNLGRGVFDDGFDSDANLACWSSNAP